MTQTPPSRKPHVLHMIETVPAGSPLYTYPVCGVVSRTRHGTHRPDDVTCPSCRRLIG